MSNYITVDGGTTNTRLNLVVGNEIIDTVKYNIGVGKNIESKDILKITVKKGINEILKRNNMQSADISRIICSGMITSEYGIYTVAHITVPAGIEELHSGMKETAISEISDIPFAFICGVRLGGNSLESMDMMRGEETELMGIADDEYGECIYVLPGSHSKIIRTDKNGRITDFSTMLTGEMIYSLSQNTILKDAVDMKNTALIKEYLIKGYEYCKENGINKALFKTRVLKNMFAKSADEVYSFFMGVVLCGEISEILKQDSKCIVIGGKTQIKNAMYELLRYTASAEVVRISDETADKAATLGMLKIFKKDGK